MNSFLCKTFSAQSPQRLKPFALLLILVALVLSIMVWQSDFSTSGDFKLWKNDGPYTVACIKGDPLACESISVYALAYNFNGVITHFFSSWNEPNPLATVAIINALFFFMPLFFFWLIHGIAIGSLLGFIYLMSLLPSTLIPFYIYSGNIEVQLGVWMGLCMASFTRLKFSPPSVSSTPPFVLRLIILLSTIALPLYKEINVLPFVVALIGALMLYSLSPTTIGHQSFAHPKRFLSHLWTQRQRWFRPLMEGSLLGLVIGIALVISYNHLRFDSWLPQNYIADNHKHNVPLFLPPLFLLGSIFSPNVGIIVFWSLSFVVLRVLIKAIGYVFHRLVLIWVAILVLGSLVGFSFWFAPTGWMSWGNRLMIPSLLGGFIALIATAMPKPSVSVPEPLSKNDNPHPPLRFFKVMSMSLWVIYLLLSINYTIAAYFSKDKSSLYLASILNLPYCREIMTMQTFLPKKQKDTVFATPYYHRCAMSYMLKVPILNDTSKNFSIQMEMPPDAEEQFQSPLFLQKKNAASEKPLPTK